jgi:large subunit ribosomal protein L15
MPIHRRLPKRGFSNIFRKDIAIVNVRDLAVFESGSVVNTEALLLAGIVKGRFAGIKLLGKGEINFPLTIQVHMVSQSAGEKITAAGGSIEEI